jgi:hypothetical protein
MAASLPTQLEGGPKWGQKALVFPLPASKHGLSMITVIVGANTEWPVRTFTVHKNLLCRASDYFDGALNGPFLENSKNELVLADDCPTAFEVLYHWLYTGFFYEQTFPTRAEKGHGSEDGIYWYWELYWLEIYQFAECRLISHLQEHAINQFRPSYDSQNSLVPCRAFVERLFVHDSGLALLQEYFVGHIAFWLLEGSNEYHVYKEVFEACDGRVAQQVTLKLASWYAFPPQDTRCHPCDELAFREARAEAIRLCYASAGSSPG